MNRRQLGKFIATELAKCENRHQNLVIGNSEFYTAEREARWRFLRMINGIDKDDTISRIKRLARQAEVRFQETVSKKLVQPYSMAAGFLAGECGAAIDIHCFLHQQGEYPGEPYPLDQIVARHMFVCH